MQLARKMTPKKKQLATKVKKTSHKTRGGKRKTGAWSCFAKIINFHYFTKTIFTTLLCNEMAKTMYYFAWPYYVMMGTKPVYNGPSLTCSV